MEKFELNAPIPWNRLSDCHGTCADYPAKIEKLLFGDVKQSHNAYWQLENFAVIQRDLYPVAPFLASYLSSKLSPEISPDNKVRSYNLLTELALGQSDEQIRLEEGQFFLGEACKRVTAKSLTCLLGDAKHPNSKVREGLSWLLLGLGEFAKPHSGEIIEWIAIEEVQVIADILNECLQAMQD